jgi:CheY-like chemotaxis protein
MSSSSESRAPVVLILDDNEDNRDMYATALHLRGFSVVASGNGHDGWLRARAALPDLIVTDLGLPGIDGWELISRVRSDATTRRIPVVIVTGWTGPAISDRASTLHGVELLTKPCSPDTLADEIRRILTAAAGGPGDAMTCSPKP